MRDCDLQTNGEWRARDEQRAIAVRRVCVRVRRDAGGKQVTGYDYDQTKLKRTSVKVTPSAKVLAKFAIGQQ